LERRLAAILAADVVGFSRLMGKDEAGTLERLNAIRDKVLKPLIAEHHGRIVKLMGDGLLVEFPSVVDAVICSLAWQKRVAKLQVEFEEDKQLKFRIGINLGDVIVEGDDIHGDGVNIAARLEELATPGSVSISGTVFDQVESKLEIAFKDMGTQTLKNIDKPIRVYRIPLDAGGVDVDEVAAAKASLLKLPDKPSIAVLAFDNMSNDAEHDYFADGIAEDIITALSKFRWLFVIAHSSTFTFKGKATDVAQIARELGVRYVLQGSVRMSGHHVRITTQLIDASMGVNLWAERYDRELIDVFEVQDEITQTIVGTIEPELYVAEEQRAKRKAPGNLDAWDLVMRARPHLWEITKTGNEEALTLLNDAVTLDPDYARAHGLLAFAYIIHAWMGWSGIQQNFILLAEEHALKAVQLDGTDPWGHIVWAVVRGFGRNHEEAVESANKALYLNPSFAMGYGLLGMILAWGGRTDETIEAFEQATRLSPRDPANMLFLVLPSVAYFAAGRYEESLAWAERSVRERPEFVVGWRMIVASLANLGRVEEAKAALERVKHLHPDFSLTWAEAISPWYRADNRKRFIEGLKLAGAPE
jgi:TolB-like protein/cytochrome c-type biogenesis protein CcmH/NrfG